MAKVNDDGRELLLTEYSIPQIRLTADVPGGALGWISLQELMGKSFPIGEKISTIAELDGDKGATVGVHEVSLDRNHPVFGYNYFSLITLPTDGDDAGESQLAIVPSDDLSSPTRLYIRMGSSNNWSDWTLVNGGGITDLGVISDWGNIVDTGIYKYKFISESGITGLLFVTSSPKKNGSGRDYFQYRLEYGKIYKRTGASVVTGRYEWGEWQTGLSASDISYDNMGSEGQEDYTNVQNAINGLFNNKMSSPIATLDTKDEVANCITPGSYGVSLFGDPDPLFGEQFSLLVLNVNGDGDIYMQIGIKAGDDNHIMAIREGTSGSWTEWEEVATKKDIEAIPDPMHYAGTWNASTNTPTLKATDTAKSGYVYRVTTAGTQFSLSFKVGDRLVYNEAGQAEKWDTTDEVWSVNGKTGDVSIAKADIGLGNVDNTSDVNKPVSNAVQSKLNETMRYRGAISAGVSLNSIYGVGNIGFWTVQTIDSASITNKPTDENGEEITGYGLLQIWYTFGGYILQRYTILRDNTKFDNASWERTYTSVGNFSRWKQIATEDSLPKIVQSTGQSTTAVMSQKAVTDAIKNIPGGSGVQATDIALGLTEGSQETQYKDFLGRGYVEYQTSVNIATDKNEYVFDKKDGIQYAFMGEHTLGESIAGLSTGIDIAKSYVPIKIIADGTEYVLHAQPGVRYPLELIRVSPSEWYSAIQTGVLGDAKKSTDFLQIDAIITGDGYMSVTYILSVLNTDSVNSLEVYTNVLVDENKVNLRLNIQQID